MIMSSLSDPLDPLDAFLRTDDTASTPYTASYFSKEDRESDICPISEIRSLLRCNDSIKQQYLSTILANQQEREGHDSGEELTLNNLKFKFVGLFGRDKEIKTLQGCLQKVVSGDEGRGLVMISGPSGSGKTALALSLVQPVKRQNGIMLTGTFEFHLRDEPYSGIAAACRELCGELRTMREDPNKKVSFEQIRDKIISELGEEIHQLKNIIPHLAEVIGDKNFVMVGVESQGSFEAKAQQLNYAFRKLIRIVSSHCSPLVILLDDLQWADIASLELVEVLMTDSENRNLMLIGCYRSNNEVDDMHVMSKVLRDMQAKQKRDGFDTTDIQVGNLNVNAVNQIIMALLSIDDESSTCGLAKICHKRTLGNAFLVITFMTILLEENLLEFNLGSFGWNWDESTVEKATKTTSNVIDMMKEKMTKVDSDLSQLLQYAAVLGNTFNEKIIGHLWEKCGAHSLMPPNKRSHEQLIEQAIEENLFEIDGASRYRWVHDKIREAALALVPSDKLVPLQFQIGMTLFLELSESELEDAIFAVANLLNNGNGKGTQVAELNLRAAKKAKEFAAFEGTAMYAKKGISLLPTNHWFSNSRLSLQLYSAAGEAEGVLGNIDEMESYCNEVLRQKHIGVLGKLRIYNVLLVSLGQCLRAKEALKLAVEVLKKLDCRFPANNITQGIQAISSCRKVMKMKNTLTAETVSNLPLMSDPIRIESMKILDKVLSLVYYLGDNMSWILVVTRMMRWTVRHGICVSSPAAFVAFGIFLSGGMGQFQAGTQFAEYGLRILERLPSKDARARTLSCSWFAVFCWTKPIQMSIKAHLQAYKIGMQVGDTESSMWGACMFSNFSFVSGKPLKTIEANCRIYHAQIEDLKREATLGWMRLLWQTSLNLMGWSDNTVVLAGDAIHEKDEDIFLQKLSESQDAMLVHVFYAYKHILCAYFGQHELGAYLGIAKGDNLLKVCMGTGFGMINAFVRGISCFAMARKTKKGKYKRHAMIQKSKIEKWLQKGNPNVKHYAYLLRAEEAALGKKASLALDLYKKSITAASRGGFVQDVALASERCAEFLFTDMDDTDQGMFYMEKAITCYSEWGAAKKVDMLRDKYCDQVPAEITTY